MQPSTRSWLNHLSLHRRVQGGRGGRAWGRGSGARRVPRFSGSAWFEGVPAICTSTFVKLPWGACTHSHMSPWHAAPLSATLLAPPFPRGAQVLAGPWFLDRKNEVPQGKGPAYCLPIVNVHEVGDLTFS